MKTFLIIFMSMIISSVSYAATATYFEGDTLKAVINTTEEAERLYTSLEVVELEGRSGYAKIFKTQDEVTEISCTKSRVPIGLPFTCTLSIDFSLSTESSPTYERNGAGMVSIYQDAETLYNALNIEEIGGRSGIAKNFKTEDSKAEIHCTKSTVPVGMPYACTVSIVLPE